MLRGAREHVMIRVEECSKGQSQRGDSNKIGVKYVNSRKNFLVEGTRCFHGSRRG